MNSSNPIAVKRNSHSVNIQLVRELDEARVFPERIDVWYGGQKVEELPRLRSHRLSRRLPPTIDWLVQKAGSAGWRVRESREGQDPHAAGCGAGTDSQGPPDILHHLRNTVQGLLSAKHDLRLSKLIKNNPVMRSDDRRFGLYPADARGDGSGLHASGGALRRGSVLLASNLPFWK